MITFTVRHFKQFEVFSVYTDVKAKKNYTVCSLDFSQLDKVLSKVYEDTGSFNYMLNFN